MLVSFHECSGSPRHTNCNVLTKTSGSFKLLKMCFIVKFLYSVLFS
uniref:Uncharacterized protein n=1 Tax=Rhizophora mucronata TaxID=61149 RepID=A0A2P2QY92_RHIMU